MPQKIHLDKKKTQKNFSFRKHPLASLSFAGPDIEPVTNSIFKIRDVPFIANIFHI
jgi:hypothetical protein